MGSGGTGEGLHAAASSSMVENRWGFMYRASLACRSDLLTMVLDEKKNMYCGYFGAYLDFVCSDN